MRRRHFVGIAGGLIAVSAPARHVIAFIADLGGVQQGVDTFNQAIGSQAETDYSPFLTVAVMAVGIGLVMLSRRIPESEIDRRARLQAVDVWLPEVMALAIKVLRSWTRECEERFGGGTKNLSLVALRELANKYDAKLELHQVRAQQMEKRRKADDVDHLALALYAETVEIKLWIDLVALQLPRDFIAKSIEYTQWQTEAQLVEGRVTLLWGAPKRDAIVAERVARVPAQMLFRPR
jgi:hypothetical protein